MAIAQFHFIPLSADYSSFPSSDSTGFVQVYLSVYQGNLQYIQKEDNTFGASFTTQLEITQDGAPVQSLSHKYQNTTTDTTRLKQYNQFVDVFSIELPFGAYKALVRIKDNINGLQGEYVLTLKTLKPTPELSFSDIELCTKIIKDTTQNIFFKNGFRVVPNPKAVYNILNPLFYYYLELDNLSFSTDQENLYSFSYTVTNSEGDTLRQKPAATKKIAGSRLVEIGGMNVIALPKGVYFFNAKAKDLSSGAECTATKKFMVYKPEKKKPVVTASQPPKISNHYIGLSFEQLEDEFYQANYISTSKEKSVFKNLQTIEAKQLFLTQFWNRQDQQRKLTPGTFRREYLKRIEIAIEKYTRFGRKGWKTDMGRVFIVYGEPDEYERHPSSIDKLPYVIWHYHALEGGAQFIFADQEGFGEFRLIHSSYRRELQNPNWLQIISKQSGSPGF